MIGYKVLRKQCSFHLPFLRYRSPDFFTSRRQITWTTTNPLCPPVINVDAGVPTALSSEAKEDTAFAILLGSTHAPQDYGFSRCHETPDRAQNSKHFRGIGEHTQV